MQSKFKFIFILGVFFSMTAFSQSTTFKGNKNVSDSQFWRMGLYCGK